MIDIFLSLTAFSCIKLKNYLAFFSRINETICQGIQYNNKLLKQGF